MTVRLTALGIVLIGMAAWAAPPLAPEPRPIPSNGERLPPGAIARLGTNRYSGDGGWEYAQLSDDGEYILLSGESWGGSLIDLTTGITRNVFTRFATNGIPERIPLVIRGNRVFGHNHEKLLVWEADTGKLLHEYTGLPFENKKQLGVGPLSVSSDGKVLTFGNGGIRSHEANPVPRKRVVRVFLIESTITVKEFESESWAAYVTPDGKSLVTHGPFGDRRKRRENDPICEVQAWDIESGKLRYQKDTKLDGIQHIGFSPDSTKMLLVNLSGLGEVWDFAAGQQICELEFLKIDQERSRPYWAFSPDGKTVAFQDYRDAGIQVWDTTTGKRGPRYSRPHFHLEKPRPWKEHAWGSGAGVYYLRDGTLAGLTSCYGQIVVWDAVRERLLTPLQEDGFRISNFRLNQDGTLMRFLAGPGEVREWLVGTDAVPVVSKVNGNRLPKSFASNFDLENLSKTGRYGVVIPIYLPDGQFHDPEYLLYDFQSDRSVLHLREFNGLAVADRTRPELVLSPNDEYVAILGSGPSRSDATADCCLILIDLKNTVRTHEFKLEGTQFGKENAWLTSCAFSADSKRLAIAYFSRDSLELRKLTLWDVKTNRALCEKEFPQEKARNNRSRAKSWSLNILTAPDNRTVILSRNDGNNHTELLCWDTELNELCVKGRIEAQFDVSPVWSLSPDGRLLAISTYGLSESPQYVWVVEWPSCVARAKLPTHRQGTRQLAFSGDSRRLACTWLGKVIVWNIPNKR